MPTNTPQWKNYKECLLDLEERCISLDDAIGFIETQISLARAEMKAQCLAVIPLGMTYYDDLTQKDYRDGYNQAVDDSRNCISSL